MATEKERLELELLATDAASAVVDRLSGKVDALDGTEAEVELSADDNASSKIESAASELRALDGEEAEVEVSAEDKATGEVDRIKRRLASLTDAERRVVIAGKIDKLEAAIRTANARLADVDGERAEAVIDARDDASALITALQSELNDIDGRIATTRLDVQGGPAARAEVRDTADTIQSGIGPLRGFTDELGESTQQAGTWANAIIDSGEAIQIFGAKLGADQRKLGKISAAIGAVGIGVGLVIAAFGKLAANRAQREAWHVERVEAYEEAIKDALGAVEGVNTSLRETGELMATVDSDSWNPFAGADQIDIVPLLARAGITFNELVRAMEQGGAAYDELLIKIGNSGGGWDDYTALLAYAAQHQDAFREAQQAGTDQLAVFGHDLTSAAEALDMYQRASGDITNGEMADVWQTLAADIRDGRLETVEAADAMNTLKAAYPGITDVKIFQAATKLVADQDDAVDKLAATLTDGLVDAQAKVVAAVADGTAAHEAQADAVTAAAVAIRDEYVAALEDEIDALVEANELRADYIGTVESLADQQKNLPRIQRDWNEQLATYNAVTADAEATTEDRIDATDRLVDAAIKQAEAEGRLAETAADLAGASDGAVRNADTMRASLLQAAAAARGPARQGILDYLYAINDIPAEHHTSITAAVNRGDIDTAERILLDTSRTRRTLVEAHVVQAAIDATRGQLDTLTARRTVPVDADTTSFARRIADAVAAAQAAARISVALKGLTGRATGDPHWRGGPVEVGEQGDEWVKLPHGVYDLPQGAQINPAGRGPTGGGGHTYVTNVTNNWPAGVDSRSARSAQRAYERRNGPQ